jgi:hypothetical protein
MKDAYSLVVKLDTLPGCELIAYFEYDRSKTEVIVTQWNIGTEDHGILNLARVPHVKFKDLAEEVDYRLKEHLESFREQIEDDYIDRLINGERY